MDFKQESSTKKIKEFLDLVENDKIEIRRYRSPVLVWAVEEGTVYYSIWEQSMLDQFGLHNVDGWDYKEDALFCPDWISDFEDEDFDDDDDDDDFSVISNLRFPPPEKKR
ncbi:MAG TPA: hypothetical protein GX398_05885 [Candidatus Cloacimonetes bacterium]|jgi:hypothetical protein|nr:hypothetical protein [Candidatus Cloacimonas sp.]HHZ15619.1 hypothetical protein [Candidatus Cloacimonadota bacterium]